MINAFTIDVEDYFQVSAFDSAIARADWERLPCRVEANTNRMLELLARCQVTATFFVLGWVAERYRSLIRNIADCGHEVASHGCDHVRLTRMSREAIIADIRHSKQLLEDITGTAVRGYRAPTFSITTENLWVHSELAAAGYDYSSSIYPIAHDLYGIPDAGRTPYRDASSGLLEIPITTLRAFGRNWPAGGGGYFRLLPYRCSKWVIKTLNEKEHMPCIFYTHPWEIDPDQPAQTGVSVKTRFRHYTNLKRMESKLLRVLGDFQWGRMDRVFLGACPAT